MISYLSLDMLKSLEIHHAAWASISFNIDGYVCQQDVASEIAAELQGYPDFIIGNYSDGNLVASLLAYKMGVTQVLVPLLYHLTLPYKMWKLMLSTAENST